MYRGNPLAFEADPIACSVAALGIAKDFDRAIEADVAWGASFFYLPLMHAESVLAQVAAVALCEGAAARGEGGEEIVKYKKMGVKFAERHRDAIVRFGRFPGRNVALGRESTDDEKEVLKENPHGF